MSGACSDTGADYLTRVHDDPAEIDPAAWDELLDQQGCPTPFMRHAWLLALHRSGSSVPATGWSPRFLTLEQAGRLVGAAALYLKAHSWGEYVFDWAWADAYNRHGLRYYPKLLGASPFTPVPGSRLLARDAQARLQLARSIRLLAEQQKLSSAHLLFPADEDRAALQQDGWLIREGVQFHWQADAAQPCPDFAAFLGTLQRHKRKNIAQERRRVAEAGVSFRALEGAAIDEASWDFFYACYCSTYAAHGSAPYLTREFFRETAATLPDLWLMFVAERDGERVAASLVGIDRQRGVAWGRYWGCLEHIACLHFEACYYQPLQWCIEQGFVRFEGGAQGEHKMARGLLPVVTTSAHWLRDARFADAVADFLAREGAGVANYVDELRERNPFRKGDAPPSSSSPR